MNFFAPPVAITRRRFMQGAAAAGPLSLIPSPLGRAFAATAPITNRPTASRVVAMGLRMNG